MNYQNIFLTILIISILLIDQFRSKKVANIITNVFFKLILLIFLVTIKDKRLIVLTGLFYLCIITISHSVLEKEGFNKDLENSSNALNDKTYCYPKGNGNCKDPWVESANDSRWCCKGEGCKCISSFPPTQCFPKNSDKECPEKNMFTASDNDDLCCFTKNCKCNPDPSSPLPNTCSGVMPVEPEEKEEEPACPCKPELKCERDESDNDNNKEESIEVSPNPGIKVCSYIKNNKFVSESGKVNISKDPVFDVTL